MIDKEIDREIYMVDRAIIGNIMVGQYSSRLGLFIIGDNICYRVKIAQF